MSFDIYASEETQIRLKKRPYVRLILESMRAEELQRSQGIDDSITHHLNQRTEFNQNDSGQSSTSGTSTMTDSETRSASNSNSTDEDEADQEPQPQVQHVDIEDDWILVNLPFAEQYKQDHCSDTPSPASSSNKEHDAEQRPASSSSNPSEDSFANSSSSRESWTTASESSLPRPPTSSNSNPSSSSCSDGSDEYYEALLDLTHLGIPTSPPIQRQTFVLYMDPRYEFTQKKVVTFYVETTRHEAFTGPAPFIPRVEAPNGYPVMPINVSVDPVQPSRYICTFRAIHLGVYTVSAHIGSQLDYHIQNSPISILISQLAIPNKDMITIMEPMEPGLESFLPIYPKLNSPVRDTLRHYFELQSPAKLFQNATCKPWGIAAHPFNQDVFVAARENDEILRYSYQGGIWNLVFRFGVPGTEPGYLHRPIGIAVDGVHSRLIIVDKDNHRICIFTFSGQFISTFGRKGHISGGEFFYPWGVAVSPNGNYIAVADSQNCRIQLFDRNGTFIRLYNFASLTNPQGYNRQFCAPRGIVFDNSGTRIFVSDFKLRNVFALNLNFKRSTEMFPRKLLRRPEGIAVDRNGNLLVCDTGNCVLQVLSHDRKQITAVPMNEDSCPMDVTVCFGGFVCFLDVKECLRLY